MRNSLLVAGTVAATISTAAAQTPPVLATVVHPSSGHTYHLLDNSNWTDAQAAAQTLGGHLATVEDIAENSYLTSQFSTYGGVTRHLWIGFTDSAVEGTWDWVSGSTSSFTNWWIAGGAPNNSLANDPLGEDFVCIYPTGEWEDLHDHASSQWFPTLCGVVEVESLGTRYCSSAVPNSTGVAGRIEIMGSPIAAGNNLALTASALPANAFGFFLTSTSQGSTAQPGGSQGVLCVGGAIGRYVGPGQILNSGAAGTFTLSLDLTQHPTPTGFVTVTAGETWNFQGWHRDAVGGMATSNFTDAVSVSFQ